MSETIGDYLDEPYHGPRRIEQAVSDAVTRGAITSDARAQHWLMQGDEAVGQVDALHGSEVLASAKLTRRWSLETDEPLRASGPGEPSGGDLNPLLSEMTRHKPALVAAARAENPDPPRLFASRDLPLATASGASPQILASLPWQLRRPAAAARSVQEFYDIVEAADDPLKVEEYGKSAENEGYRSRFSEWLKGAGEKPQPKGVAASGAADYSVEALHRELFQERSGPYEPEVK
jgi:hypothetical protein